MVFSGFLGIYDIDVPFRDKYLAVMILSVTV